MKNKNTNIAVLIAASFFISSIAFAQDDTPSVVLNTNDGTLMTVQPVQPVSPKLEQNGEWFFKFLKLKDTLTAEEQTQLKAILDDFHKKTQEIVWTDWGKMDSSKLSQITSLNKEFYVALKPFVDPTKIDLYEKWFTEKFLQFDKYQTMLANKTNWDSYYADDKKMNKKDFVKMNDDKIENGVKHVNEENKSLKKENKPNFTKKQQIKIGLISKALRELFVKKLDSVPNEKKETAYKKLISKIDVLLGKTTNVNQKWKLTELRDIVQEKLDSITVNTDDESLINQLLEGSDSAN